MKQEENKIKGFFSYSHFDAAGAKELLDNLQLLIKSGDLELWYDCMIEAGEKWEPEIETHLNSSQLIVFCITQNFIDSTSCMNEFRKAIELKKNNLAEFVPIILDDCDWLNIKGISEYQAEPEYGKSIASFLDKNIAYKQVNESVENKVALLKRRANLCFNKTHEEMLQSVDPLLKFSVSEHLELKLKDIYVNPELRGRHDENKLTDTTSEDDIVEMLISGKKILLSGESQSGKTSLCRHLCMKLFDCHYLPIYVDGHDGYSGKICNQIKMLQNNQYSDPDCMPEDRMIIIFDDFFKCRNPEKYLSSLPEKYCSILVVLDDVYELNMRYTVCYKEFEPYALIPMRARKRIELIRKWLAAQDKDKHEPFDNFKKQDRITSNVEVVLGKMFNRGLLPAYPFYILSILITTEITGKPLNQEISTQGYCYQALLYAGLRRIGVRNQQIDIYVNFLSELAYMLFKKKMCGRCSEEELQEFVKNYKSKYTLLTSTEEIFNNLERGRLFGCDSLGSFDFIYPYIKYYFIAKYLVEHYGDCEEDFQRVFTHLGSSSNAYIAIFMSHHDRSIGYLDSIKVMIENLFHGKDECYLTKVDVKQFDERSQSIVQAVLPSPNVNPEEEREKILIKQEHTEMEYSQDNEQENEHDVYIRDFICATRLCQVLGMILKSRPGSIMSQKQHDLIMVIIDVYARILRVFFDTFKDEEAEKAIIEYIAFAISKHKISLVGREGKLRELASKIFWNLNFMTTYSILIHCTCSIGSNELSSVIREACSKKQDAPLLMAIPFFVDILYKKYIDVDAIRRILPSLPLTVQSMLKWEVARFCTVHRIKPEDRQRIEHLFKLPNTLPIYIANNKDNF